MRRASAVVLLGLLFVACTSAGDRPAAQPTATPTDAPQVEKGAGCQIDTPAATLSYGDQRESNARVSINWVGDGCAVNGHPSFMFPLPSSALTIPVGERAKLKFSVVPDSVGASVWRLTLENVTPISSGIQIPLSDANSPTRFPLVVEAAVEQEIDLGALLPGEYVIQLGAEWPQGSLGFAFRVEIIEPGAS